MQHQTCIEVNNNKAWTHKSAEQAVLTDGLSLTDQDHIYNLFWMNYEFEIKMNETLEFFR